MASAQATATEPDDEILARYLGRLALPGLASAAPSLAGLRALHSIHVERVAYETLDLYRRRPPPMALDASARLIAAGRGGYCFTLNGGFAWLLQGLGYDVRMHRARVQSTDPSRDDPAEVTHLALTVHGLDEDPWLVDVGLGDALHDPVPLRCGSFTQGPFTYVMSRSLSGLGSGWWFGHAPGMAFTGVHIADAEATTSDFDRPHQELGCGSKAHFSRRTTAIVRLSDRVLALRGCVVTDTDGAGSRHRVVEAAQEWWALLEGPLGLVLDDIGSDERALLWARQRREHDEWVAATGWTPSARS